MDSLSLSGIFKGATNPTIYKSIGNDLYNSSSKISSLYDTNITTPSNNQLIYFLTPTFRNKSLSLATGRTSNIFWNDMIGASPGTGSSSLTITYTNASNRFLQFQRSHAGAFINSASLDATKMRTNNIFSLLNTVDVANRAYSSAVTINRSSSAVQTVVAASYLLSDNQGVLLRNDCYNRNFEINGFLTIPVSSVTQGARFTVYIYLGTDIIAQTDICCNTENRDNYVNIYAVIRTTFADVNKYIDFKIRYSGSVLVTSSSQMSFSVKSL